ncbi:MAG: sugar kinase [Pseudomonadota bacterium]|nr:sugar kinase [Pseudomonadota bacterium]
MTVRVAAIGECMLELSGGSASEMTLSFGGDTLNTSVYLARLGLVVDYLTALGDDPYSDNMIAAWQAEGIGTSLVVRAADRLPGLYIIRTDASGERQFHYWRQTAPARELPEFPNWQQLADHLPSCGLIYFSGITLSLYSTASRERLREALSAARDAGSRIAFDTNYRPRVWPNAATARGVIESFLPLVDIALPTLDDEADLFGETDAERCADRLHNAGISEVAIKLGADGCLFSSTDERRTINAPITHEPIDTTGAGDAFNAGYLAARLMGDDPATAANKANLLAGKSVMHRGAVIPLTAMPR